MTTPEWPTLEANAGNRAKHEVLLRVFLNGFAQTALHAYYVRYPGQATREQPEETTMGLQCAVDPTTGLVEFTATGKIVLSDVLQLAEQIQTQQAVTRSMRFFVDVTRMDWVPTTAEVRRIVQMIPECSAQIRPRIAVAVAGSLHFGLARMAAILAEPRRQTLHVLLDRDIARQWVLGDEPVAQQELALKPRP